MRTSIRTIYHTSDLLLLKLGGSLITDKNRERTPRPEVMKRLADEIATALQEQPNLRLLLGHGAGSFAHVPAKKYATRQGVHGSEQWLGFAEVWWQAAALNRLVMDTLHAANLPAIALPPSASVVAKGGKVAHWELGPIQMALQAKLIPVIFGDVVFDLGRGGTILSTEELFEHLAHHLEPSRILLAGIEEGVWADYPLCTQLVPEITPHNYAEIAPHLGASNATDVTGGMAAKVQQSLALVKEIPNLEVLIFSGLKAGNLSAALRGAGLGTLVRAREG
jgi:isopentenyl phosphate kinase